MSAKFSIKTTSSFFLFLCLTVILFFTLSCFSADPDPLQDICVADLNSTVHINGYPCKPESQATSDDFFFSGLMDAASTDNPFGFGVKRGDVKTFPGLNTQGLSVNRVDIAPGGIIPLHVHPRASEANFVLEGNVLVGFITTADVLYSKVRKVGDLSIIPRGLVHFVTNVGKEKAVLIAIFNSQLPGIAIIPNNLFASNPAIPIDILAKNFRVDEKVIDIIKSKFGNQTNIAEIYIKATSSFFLVLCLAVILFFTLSCFSSDPDPLQDICVADLNSKIKLNGYPCKPESQVTSNDFFFSGLMTGASTANPFGIGLKRGDVTTFPGLNTQGLTVSRIDLAPGGIIPLHVHPRASQANFIIKGKVYFGIITTTDVLYAKVMKPGELNIIPRGLVHFAANVGPGKAIVLAILNSQLPGFSTIPFNLFNSTPPIPNYILAKNFRVDEKVIAIIKSQFAPNAMASKFSIKTTSSFFLVLCLTVILFFTLSCFSADPDPLQDICVADLNSTIKLNGYPCKPESQVTSNNFFFRGLMTGASTDNPEGIGIKFGDVTTFPGLNTQGLTVNRIDIAPGGIIPLHVHPRASEANFLMKGKLFFGFITTADVLYAKVMKPGELNIIPRGLVHFAANVGQGKAIVLAILNSQLPGIARIPFNLFNSTPPIPNFILAKNFRVDEKVIAIIKFSIKTTSLFFLVLCLTVVLFFTLSCFSADPDPLQDICVADLNSTINMNGYPCKPESQVTSDDFFFSGLMNEASTANPVGAGLIFGDVKTFPGLNTQGLSVNRIDLAPGGIIPLHTHARASEANFITKGKVYFGFITTADVLYSKVMEAKELTIIPRGLVHFAANVGPGKAIVLAILNSQLPGFSTLPNNFFASTPSIPNDILAKNFRVDEKVIAIIKSKFLLCLTVILFFTLSCFSADPDPLQDICVADLNSTIKINGYPCKPESQVTSDDFFFSGLMTGASTANPEGFGIRLAVAATFPGLNTQGLTVVRIDLAPGGIIPLHVHPRGSEANLIIEGKVYFGFITTTDVLYAKVMEPGELNIIPRGLVHFAANVGPGKAVVIAALNSQLPGFANIPLNLFNSTPPIPNFILAKNFRVDEKITAIIKSKFALNGSLADGTWKDI
ncbi:hypothetical protein MKX01_040503 [Papaver californicum]|nr:hypothetical protein MKX01_040503 [Papaver californicum]